MPMSSAILSAGLCLRVWWGGAPSPQLLAWLTTTLLLNPCCIRGLWEAAESRFKKTCDFFPLPGRALQFPPEGWLRMGLNNGSITWLTIRPSGRVALRALGDAGFMPPEKLTRT